MIKKYTQFLVLCNFKYFIIYDTRNNNICYEIPLALLPERVDSFKFLFGLIPQYVPEQENITRESAKLVGKLYKSILERKIYKEEDVDLFILQCLFCMFAEDLDYLPREFFSYQVKRIKDGEDNSAGVLTDLFKMMDEKDKDKKNGRYEPIQYFNGPLFARRPEIVLDNQEMEYLSLACNYNWKNVRPEIFGSVFESAVEKKERHDSGIHFTSELDIMKVVKPCIVDYWEEKLLKCNTAEDYKKLHVDLKKYRVLDPACGSGNFLLIAYRELKKIESKIFLAYHNLTGTSYIETQNILGHYSIEENIHGIEIRPFAVLLSKVSLWIARRLLKEEYCFTEEDLPLRPLKHIIETDALLLANWDEVDVVISNPPYLGCKKIREALGNDYFNLLSEKFPNHNKMSDYCTYWYAQVFREIKPNTRVGFITTNSITHSNSREVSLDQVIKNSGTIFNAISKQQWSGDATVHVSIVNFINKGNYEGEKYLDGNEVDFISSRLSTHDINTKKPRTIRSNINTAFEGCVISGKGFIIDEVERDLLIRKNKKNEKVIKQFLIGEDINHDPRQAASRWIIDFQDWCLEDASVFKEPFELVKSRVKPVRELTKSNTKDSAINKQKWWKFVRPRMEMRKKVSKLEKLICLSRVTKRPIFVFIENDGNILPADSTVVIASNDYNLLGIMQSVFHTEWFRYQGGTFETRLRYTNTTVFETFPFPENIDDNIGDTMKKIESYRKDVCQKFNIGLTALYNQMNDGGHDILKRYHQQLDNFVAECYEYPKKEISNKENMIKFLIE